MNILDVLVEKINERKLYVDFVVSGECPKNRVEKLLRRISELQVEIDSLGSLPSRMALKKIRRKNIESNSKINGKHNG